MITIILVVSNEVAMQVRFSSLDPEISKTPISEIANKMRICNDGKQLRLMTEILSRGTCEGVHCCKPNYSINMPFLNPVPG